MTNKKRSILPKFEVLIILVFFFSFIVWAVSKCSKTKESLQDETEETASSETPDEASIPDSLTTTLSNPALNSAQNTSTSNTTATTAAQSSAVPKSNFAPLFVTIDGLNMRTEPELDSDVILKLKLFEQVNYLGEFTDSTTVVNLGYEIADEPWFKVQHSRGKVGWVYGAGVNFYKKKRKGVLE